MDATAHETESPVRRRSAWMAGAAAGVLLVLLVAPATRWLLLSQLWLSAPTPGAVAALAQNDIIKSPADADYADRAFRDVASRTPDDLQIQIAAVCLIRPDHGELNSQTKVLRLRALETRFPDRPELYATALRFATQGEVMVHREEEGLVSGDPAKNTSVSRPCKPEALESFDRDAAAGERLDPDNAYFPFMRAIGLFNSHRDAEALAAVHRAADRPTWHEYYDQELKGESRMQDIAFGNRSALLHTTAAMALLFPHYASLRAVTRMEIFHAIEAEKAGRVEEGLAIRQDVLACGRSLRTRASCIIGPMVGIALERLAVARPGGELDLQQGATTENHAKITAEEQFQKFAVYLKRIGRTEEDGPFHSELLAGDRVKSLVESHRDDLWPISTLFFRLVSLWTADLVLLSNAIWLLALGGLAALLLRKGRLQAGLPLSASMRWSVPTGLIASLFVAPCVLNWHMFLFTNITDIAAAYGSCAFAIAIALSLPALVLPTAGLSDRLRRLGTYVGSLAVGCVMIGLVAWQIRGVQAFAGLVDVFFNLSGGSAGADSASRMWHSVVWGCVIVTSLVPLMIVIAAVVSKFCRVPVSVGVARALRGLAVPVASVLIVIYGLLLLPTLRSEAALQYSMDRTIQNEGKYLAEIAGKTWPDLTSR